VNVLLLIAGLLSVLIGIAHSGLGERLVLGPLFRRGDLPKLLGSESFAQRTLRFTWHLTTVLLVAIGAIVMALSTTSLDAQAMWIVRLLALTFGACSLVSLIGARAKHFSWWVFLTIAALLWLGA
jgi:hypothetical protein